MILHYFRVITAFNAPFSLICAVLQCLLTEKNLDVFCKMLVVSFLTGGFILSIALFEWRYRPTYYFYFNKGYTRTRLIAGAYAITVTLAAIGLLTLKWLY